MSTIEEILSGAERIAVVGLSDDPYRTSYGIAQDLVGLGYEVVPVNPTIDSALGLKAYARLEDVPGRIDIVDVFRRPEFIPEIARSAVAVGARALWLQTGLRSPEAREIAVSGSLRYVEDRCLGVEAYRYAAHRVA